MHPLLLNYLFKTPLFLPPIATPLFLIYRWKQENQSQQIRTFKWKEVALHKSKQTGIWVTKDRKVYDITKFVDMHPGGEVITLAAGGPLDPFWKVLTIHNTEQVSQILDQYCIGELNTSEPDSTTRPNNVDKLFPHESERDDNLLVHLQYPFNAETPVEMLTKLFTTPNQLFYVRNHLPVPDLTNKWSLCVECNGKKKEYSMEDLRSMPQKEMTVTLQCAGNRRSLFKQQTQGLPWGNGAIGTARWSGVSLRNLLDVSGCTLEETNHVHFKGADGYSTSVPIDLTEDAMVAYEMNKVPIPQDHGYPIRVIVPGIIGARSVKWLHSVSIEDEEATTPWQKRDYKILKTQSPSDVDFENASSIQRMPVVSCVTELNLGNVEGYAISGHGQITRVEVSFDDGAHWKNVDTMIQDDKSPKYAWTLWKASVPKGVTKVISRATDEAGNVQPKNAEWNHRGLLNNGFY